MHWVQMLAQRDRLSHDKMMVTSLNKLYNKMRVSFCLNIRKHFFVEGPFKNQIKERTFL